MICETQKLTSEQMKKDLFARVKEIFGEADTLYRMERKRFDKAVDTDWSSEDKEHFDKLK